MSEFGFEKSGHPPCTHGEFGYRDIGDGMCIRFCGHCGRTHVLAQETSGAFLLVQVPEFGVEKWDDMAPEDDLVSDEEAAGVIDRLANVEEEAKGGKIPELAEVLPDVRPDETERPVPSRPRKARRAVRALQGVQAATFRRHDAQALR